MLNYQNSDKGKLKITMHRSNITGVCLKQLHSIPSGMYEL